MMLGVGGQIRFDLMAAVTVSLGAVCAEPLGGSGDTQAFEPQQQRTHLQGAARG